MYCDPVCEYQNNCFLKQQKCIYFDSNICSLTYHQQYIFHREFLQTSTLVAIAPYRMMRIFLPGLIYFQLMLLLNLVRW